MVATLALLNGSLGGEALFIFPSSLYLFIFFDDLEEDQKQTEGLGRSDADREIIRQWETKELLIICSDRSDNLTCEYRLTENKLRRWHRAVATDIRRPAPRCNPFTTTCMASSCLFHALLHPDTVENVNVSVNFWGDGARSSGSGDRLAASSVLPSILARKEKSTFLWAEYVVFKFRAAFARLFLLRRGAFPVSENLCRRDQSLCTNSSALPVLTCVRKTSQLLDFFILKVGASVCSYRYWVCICGGVLRQGWTRARGHPRTLVFWDVL